MKITELKIKENITPDVIAQAIEYISNSCFINGSYNPYYRGFTEKMAIVQFFLEGIEFEEGDSLFVICELDDVKKLIAKFYGDKRVNKYSPIMDTVNHNVDEIVEFRKQRLIHGADAIESIAKKLDRFDEILEGLYTAAGNLSKIDFSKVSAEDLDKTQKIIDKLASSNFELTEESIANIIKNAVAFDTDKATQEIIDAKNAQIEELKKRNALLEKEHNARNVLAFKKEVDG